MVAMIWSILGYILIFVLVLNAALIGLMIATVFFGVPPNPVDSLKGEEDELRKLLNEW
jgi:hypothetical protein